jgi:hypothetical protein
VPPATVPVALVTAEPRPPAGGGPLSPAEAEAYRTGQAALVRSEFVLNAALRDPQARDLLRGQGDAVAWLAERVTAAYADGGPVLRIGVSGAPPAEAAVLANAVAGAYVREAGEGHAQSCRARHKQLEDVRDALGRSLEAAREELRRLAAAAGVPADRADQRALLAALYHERAGLRLELARTRAGAGGCERGDGEKFLRDELSSLDARIRACEEADFDDARSRVERLRDRVEAVHRELLRLELELQSPAPVQMLAPAAR